MLKINTPSRRYAQHARQNLTLQNLPQKKSSVANNAANNLDGLQASVLSANKIIFPSIKATFIAQRNVVLLLGPKEGHRPLTTENADCVQTSIATRSLSLACQVVVFVLMHALLLV
jgi:hypothetical protein